jgi:hypothetical protein
VFLLESVTHLRELKSSLKNKNQYLDLRGRERERERKTQALDLKGAFDFLSGQQKN